MTLILSELRALTEKNSDIEVISYLGINIVDGRYFVNGNGNDALDDALVEAAINSQLAGSRQTPNLNAAVKAKQQEAEHRSEQYEKIIAMIQNGQAPSLREICARLDCSTQEDARIKLGISEPNNAGTFEYKVFEFNTLEYAARYSYIENHSSLRKTLILESASPEDTPHEKNLTNDTEKRASEPETDTVTDTKINDESKALENESKNTMTDKQAISVTTTKTDDGGSTTKIVYERQKTGLAWASFVLSIVSLFGFGFLTAVPAVICGHIQRSSIEESPDLYGGNGLAIAGLIIGYIMIALSILALALLGSQALFLLNLLG